MNEEAIKAEAKRAAQLLAMQQAALPTQVLANAANSVMTGSLQAQAERAANSQNMITALTHLLSQGA